MDKQICEQQKACGQQKGDDKGEGESYEDKIEGAKKEDTKNKKAYPEEVQKEQGQQTCNQNKQSSSGQDKGAGQGTKLDHVSS